MHIVSCDEMTGIQAPSPRPTRTEVDFARHSAQTIAVDAERHGVFIVDRLNMHQAAAPVRLVAHACGSTKELDVKGERGTLQSMATGSPHSIGQDATAMTLTIVRRLVTEGQCTLTVLLISSQYLSAYLHPRRV